MKVEHNKETKMVKIMIYEDTFAILKKIAKKMKFEGTAIYDSIISIALQKQLKIIEDFEKRRKS